MTVQVPSGAQHDPIGCSTGGQGLGEQFAPCVHVAGAKQSACTVTPQAPWKQHEPVGTGCGHGLGEQVKPVSQILGCVQSACVVTAHTPSAASQHAPVAGGGGTLHGFGVQATPSP